MKLVIMIPCLNEEATLPLVLETLPKSIAGIDEIEILIINDGSTDKTVEVAKSFGVTQFLHHTKNQGLSRSFRHGLFRSLELGADIIVQTEGDNQYKQELIPELIAPILSGKADVVISDRLTQTIEHFSPSKKVYQRLGTWVLNKVARTNVPDAISGFRAYTRQAAMQLNPVADYSWATETTIQSSYKKHAIVIVESPTNPKLRESRQFKSSWQHIRRSSITIMRGFMMYRPYALFLGIGGILFALGAIPFLHFLYLIITNGKLNGPHHLQSVVIGCSLWLAAFLSGGLGIIADLIRINRLIFEENLELTKRDHLMLLESVKQTKG